MKKLLLYIHGKGGSASESERDDLTPLETIQAFAEKHNARLTVMEGGEHWFHTDEQLRFLDKWLLSDSDG